MRISLFSTLPIFLLLIAAPFILPSQHNSVSQNSPLKDSSKQEKIELFKQMIASGECEFEGIKLYGKVQFVEHFPDFKIQYVDHFADIKVKMVDHFPDACGKWQEVEHFPDFKVQVVEHFPDLKVELVEHFPGVD